MNDPLTIDTTGIAEIRQAISDRALLERAYLDAVVAMEKFATVGLSIPAAIKRLDELREMFDELGELLGEAR